MAEKVKIFFEYDVGCFKNDELQGSKYKLEQLQGDDDDFKLLENTINYKDMPKVTSIGNNTTVEVMPKVLKIYRVVANGSASASDRSKVLLLHGTKAANVGGILKTGFKPSERGCYGPGVYMTDSFSYACNYGKGSFVQESGVVKKFRYIFVNEVEKVEGRAAPEHLENATYEQYLKNSPFVKVFNNSLVAFLCGKVANLEDSFCDVFDSKDRKISQGTFVKDRVGQKIILAHHSLVVPAYLIEIEEKFSLKSLIDEVVYLNFDLKTNQKNSTNQISLINDSDGTLEALKTILNQEINARLQEKLNILLYAKVETMIDQLSFDFNLLVKKEHHQRLKYRPKLLNEKDADYDFVMRAVGEKSNRKVLHVFKINPADKSESAELSGEYLLFKGKSSDKVIGVLTNGFHRSVRDCIHKFLKAPNLIAHDDGYTATTRLEEEVSNGSSYHGGADKTVKKISCVFLVSSGRARENPFFDAEGVTDTRGSYVDTHLIGSDEYKWEKPCKVPAYLVVFELNERDR